MNAADVVALRTLVDRYADAVDRRDEQALLTLFGEEGVLRVRREGAPDNEWVGADVVRSLEALSRYDRTFHQVGGCVFEERGDGARGRIQCMAHHYERTGNGPVDLVMFIRYDDGYSRDPAGWRISERTVAVQWTELHPAHPVRREPGGPARTP